MTESKSQTVKEYVKELTQEQLESLTIAIYDEAYEQGYICGCKDENSQHKHAIELLANWLDKNKELK